MKYRCRVEPYTGDLSRKERIPTKNTKNTGKNGEKSQGETLKNKSNHTSTRLKSTQDPQRYKNNKVKYTRWSSSPRTGLEVFSVRRS